MIVARWEGTVETLCGKVGSVDTEHNLKTGLIKLLQISDSEGNAYLIQLAQRREQGVRPLVPPQMVEWMADSIVLKIGSSIENDVSKLRHEFGIEVNGWSNLQHLSPRFHLEATRHCLKGCQDPWLKFPLSQAQGRTNWAVRSLSQAQINYAINNVNSPTVIGLLMVLDQVLKDGVRMKQELTLANLDYRYNLLFRTYLERSVASSSRSPFFGSGARPK